MKWPEYPLGTQVNSDIVITASATGSAAEPDTITARVYKPDGTNTLYTYGTSVEMVRNAAGNYSLILIPALIGFYRIDFIATGSDLNFNKTDKFEIIPVVPTTLGRT